MPHDPIARAHAQLGQAKRRRERTEAILVETLADIEVALSIVCRLPDCPERTALYACLESRAHVLRSSASVGTSTTSRDPSGR
jgi:hypothetical protein